MGEEQKNMTWIAYPEPQNITSILDLFQYANRVTDYPNFSSVAGVFGLTLPFSIFMIIIAWQHDRLGLTDSVMWASYITWFFSILLKAQGLVGDWIVVLFMIMALGSLLVKSFKKKSIEI